MHIGVKLSQLALWHADRAAILDERGACSFRQFYARLTRLGNALHGLGLRTGDRVGLLIPDIREYLEADYGVMNAGLVPVPLDPRLTPGELIALLRHAGARALIAHDSFAEKTDGLIDEVESLEQVIGIGEGIGLSYEALLVKASDAALPERPDDDLATLNFSGGTTGAPKAVMLRHCNLMAVAQNTIQGFDIHSETIFLNVRPLWPIAQVILMSHLFAGATVVLGGRADPERLATLIARTGATRTSLVPTQLVRWLDHLEVGDPNLQHLQAVYVGGSRIPPTVFERALDLLGPRIGVLYGMTEAPIITYLPPQHLAEGSDRARLMASVGHELFGYQLRIAAAEGDVAAPGPTGEVLVRGGNVMAGYWQNEAASRAALSGGWLHTGDLGRIDEHGDLSIIGRLNDVIRSGSSSILPKEVEDVIGSHPAVREVAVIGLPDEEWGEIVAAFVALRPGMNASEADLIAHCKQHLASYKKPRLVHFVDSLPRSHYGKVIRAELLKRHAR